MAGFWEWLQKPNVSEGFAALGQIAGAADFGQVADVSPFFARMDQNNKTAAMQEGIAGMDLDSMFSPDERKFIASMPPEVAVPMIQERVFAKPEPVKGVTVGNRLVNPVNGQVIYDGGGQAGYSMLSPQEVQAMGLPPGAYQRSADGKIAPVGGSGVTVNVGDGAPGLGKLSTDFGYVSDPATGKPVYDPKTGLPTAAPIPGSPAALEAVKGADQAALRDAQSANSAGVVLQDIDKAIGQVSGWTAGAGSVLGAVPGSSAKDLESSLNTIKANVGFDRLQQMREASPTGGALGGIAVQELTMLQAVLGSLDQSQSPEQLRENLTRLKQIYAPIAQKAAAYPNAAEFGFGGSGSGSALPAGLDPAIWGAMTPEERALFK